MPKTIAIFLLATLPGLTAGFGAKNDMYHVFMGGDPMEMQLARDVRRTLLTLPGYGIFDDLQFSMDGVTVTLGGEVTRPSLKAAALYAAKRIPGITLVTDRITVLPPSPVDQQIRLAEYAAIYEEPQLSIRYGYRALPPIHIVVKNGQVRLEGIVDSATDKNFAGERAKSVPNVSSVVNDLQVRP